MTLTRGRRLRCDWHTKRVGLSSISISPRTKLFLHLKGESTLHGNRCGALQRESRLPNDSTSKLHFVNNYRYRVKLHSRQSSSLQSPCLTLSLLLNYSSNIKLQYPKMMKYIFSLRHKSFIMFLLCSARLYGMPGKWSGSISGEMYWYKLIVWVGLELVTFTTAPLSEVDAPTNYTLLIIA